MWIARNKNGSLKLFARKPIRWRMNRFEHTIWVDTLGWDDHTAYGFPYALTLWESLKWEDEPIEVELTIKK